MTDSTSSSGASAARRADQPSDRAQTQGGGGGSSKDVAKDQAGKVADGAKQAGQQVAGTAKDKAGDVGSEAQSQAKDLLGQARSEVSDQAGTQQQRVAQTVSSLGGELRSMVDGSDQQGPATDLVRQAADRSDDLARWLGDRDPQGLLSDVRSFAARRPGTFLAIAAGAGLVAGRFARGLKDSPSTGSSSSSGTASSGTASSGSGRGPVRTGDLGGPGTTARPVEPVAPVAGGTATSSRGGAAL